MLAGKGRLYANKIIFYHLAILRIAPGLLPSPQNQQRPSGKRSVAIFILALIVIELLRLLFGRPNRDTMDSEANWQDNALLDLAFQNNWTWQRRVNWSTAEWIDFNTDFAKSKTACDGIIFDSHYRHWWVMVTRRGRVRCPLHAGSIDSCICNRDAAECIQKHRVKYRKQAIVDNNIKSPGKHDTTSGPAAAAAATSRESWGQSVHSQCITRSSTVVLWDWPGGGVVWRWWVLCNYIRISINGNDYLRLNQNFSLNQSEKKIPWHIEWRTIGWNAMVRHLNFGHRLYCTPWA